MNSFDEGDVTNKNSGDSTLREEDDITLDVEGQAPPIILPTKTWESTETQHDASTDPNTVPPPKVIHDFNWYTRPLSIALTLATWTVVFAWFAQIEASEGLEVYTALDSGTVPCPGNTLYSHTNATGDYCISPVGWQFPPLDGEPCPNFHADGYGYTVNPMTLFARCSNDSETYFAIEFEPETNGVPFVDYSCMHCSVTTTYKAGNIALCDTTCICATAQEAQVLVEGLHPGWVKPFTIASTTALCVLILLYHGSVAPRYGCAGWTEFVVFDLVDVVTILLMVNNVWGKAEIVTIFPSSSGEYIFNESQDKSGAQYSAEQGLIALGFMLAAENTMSTLAHFRPRREGSPLHHEFTWGVCKRIDGYIASFMIIVLMVGTLLGIFDLIGNAAYGTCNEMGNWIITPPLLAVIAIAFPAALFFPSATLRAAYNANQKVIPLYVSAMKVLVVQLPNVVATSVTFTPDLLTAWLLNMGGDLFELYSGISSMCTIKNTDNQNLSEF